MRNHAKERMNYLTKGQAQLYLCLTKFPIKRPDEVTPVNWKKMVAAKEHVEMAMGYVGLAIEGLLENIKKHDR